MSLWTLVIYLDGDSKLFLLYKYKSFQFAKGSVLYDQVPPAVEQLKREVWDIFFKMLESLNILISEFSIISKLILVNLSWLMLVDVDLSWSSCLIWLMGCVNVFNCLKYQIEITN